MANITFLTPNGDILEKPSMDLLENVVLNRGEEYWNINAGGGSRSYQAGSLKTTLDLNLDKDRGFYFLFISMEGHFVVDYSGDFSHAVEIWQGGEPAYYPAALIVPKGEAWTIVRAFCETGEKSRKYKWTLRKHLKWDYSTGLPL
ncbi:MAG: hypothetical protein FJ271_17530 [Planctomycetes bacterium]|nr:hypothetical protein [Planctomycetota bacterium]